MADQKKSTAKTIAKGAAGVAAAAGVIAGVAALADKDTRRALGKGAKNAMHMFGDSTQKASEVVQEGYRSTAHQIRLGNKKKQNKKTEDNK